MRSKYFCFTALITILFCSNLNGQSQSFKTVEPTDYIKIKVPQDYSLMSEDDKLLTFPSIRLPISAITSGDREGILGINKSNNTWAQGDLEILKSFYKSNILALHDEVDFLQDEIKTINGRDYIVFEFISQAKNVENAFASGKTLKKYNFIQYTLLKNEILIFNFYSSFRLADRFKKEVPQIMNSVEIKKRK